MKEILSVLSETSIPTIVIVSGIAMLFLALAGRFGTYVEIKTERQKAAAYVGAILFATGIAIHAYPLLSADSLVERSTLGSEQTGAGGTQSRWIIAGSFSTPSAAASRFDALSAAGINAITVDSNEYDFLCPGYFTVMVLAPNRDTMIALLEDVREVEASAFPRNPATFSREAC